MTIPPEVQVTIEHYVSSGRYTDSDHVLRDALQALDHRTRQESAVVEDIRESLREIEEGKYDTIEAVAEKMAKERGWKNPL